MSNNSIMKKQGIYSVLAAIAIQLTLGLGYIWSVFQTGVADSIFGGDNAAAGLTFSLIVAMMPVGSVIGGKLTFVYSTRLVVFAGGIIMSMGFFLASFVTANNGWLLWMTYGVMGGIGTGFSYSTTIACAQKWYPHKKGFVTGIIISALGFGGVIFTPIVESVISAFGGAGLGEPQAFMVLSIISLIVCSVGSIFIKNPPNDYMMNVIASSTTSEKPIKNSTPAEMFKTPQFYLLTATFLLGCMGGLMIIGFAKPIAVAKGLAATATIGVLAISMFNSIGRLICGAVSDKLGRINTLIVLLSMTAILSLLVNAASGYLIYVLVALVGFSYGGLLSTFPSLTADLFGAKHMAANYGFVLLGFGSGAIISSQIAGYYKNIAVNDISLMFPAFLIASCCAAAGIVMMLILKAKFINYSR
jgi:OFA family oxalate/formate antiporter-like MFS transporter